RPRLASFKQCEDGASGAIDWRGQNDDRRRVNWIENKTARGRFDASKLPQSGAQAAKFNAKPRSMRFIDRASFEHAFDEPVTRHFLRPGFGESDGKIEQDGTTREQHCMSRIANRAPAPVHDEIAGAE